ncbi:MAG TPA: hypothetical protein VIA61_11405 [Methylomirabilota bacterium]|jgi:hypothetical protein
MRHRLRVGMLAALVLLVAHAGIADAEDDAPLRVATAPYRGTVIDGTTGRPLPSVAVVILWQRLDEQIQGLRRLAAAREAFTNENGEFTHDVTAIERTLPPRTFAPRIVMFRPGYAPLPDTPELAPPGVSAARFASPGAEVRLAPVTTYDDRAEAFNTFIGMLSAAQLFPPTELPETSELIRYELQNLGVKPARPAPSGGNR